ncbi:MAG: serine/threonine-protein kinase [Polyangiaceae bacterium]
MHSHLHDDPSSERLPQAGDRIAGKYVVERVLKRGGMGVVLAARHAELDQPVAIKVLLPELSADASMVARFLREGRAVSALRSDHVVRVHDVGRLDGGTPYLVMEMLHGSDLDRRVRKGGPVAWQEAVGYVMQACEALVEAHSLGIVHRDLKPSNLFLVELPSGVATVKVLDFGISKADGLDVPLSDAHAITTTEAVLGSPTFMAPEQLKSAKYVDARADLWSLGLVLHFLIAGKLAFDAETLGSYLIKILQEPAIPLRAFRPDVPPELEAIVLRCLEKEPGNRFASAADLRAALAPFAPFAAHASGVFSAARISGSYAAAGPPPIFTGLSPSAPTPVGGVVGPALVTPVAPYPAGLAITPAGGLAAIPG